MPEGIGYGNNSIERLISMATDPLYDSPDPANVGALTQGVPQPGAQAPSMNYRMNPSYAEGGVVTPNGPPAPAAGIAAPTGAPTSPQRMDQEIQRIEQQHPQVIQQLTQMIQQAMQAGEIDPQELNQLKQLATAAYQNPQLWPQLKQFAEQQGLAEPGEFPEQYEQSMILILLIATRAASSATSDAGVPQSEGQVPEDTFKDGGYTGVSKNEDGSIAANLHEKEYVVPDWVVAEKGTDFFDKLSKRGKYAEEGKANA